MGARAPLGLASTALLAGCAQLAGIDETTGATPPSAATLTLDRVSIGAATPLPVAPLDLTGLTATYLIANPDAADGLDRVTATTDAAGVWTADVGGAQASVLFTLPDYPEPYPRLWSFPVRELHAAYAVYEHPSPMPANEAAMLTVEAALPSAYAANESFVFFSVGTWNGRNFTGAEVPAVGAMQFGPVTFQHTTLSRMIGRPYEAITQADATLLLRYVGSRLTGVMEGTPFDQTGTDTISGTLTPVAGTETLSVTLDNATVAARYTPLRPAMPAPNMEWSLTAAPGYAYAANRGPQLEGATVLAADPPALSVPYGNPFTSKGWHTVMTWSTSSSRTFTPAGAVGPATLNAGLNQQVEPAAGMTLDLPAGLPELITLDQIPLSTDGIAIDKPTRALAATFVVPPTPVNNIYVMQVFELVPNEAGTALERKVRLTMSSATPQFLIPPEFFEAGKIYTLRALTNAGGYPNAATGDFATRTLPFAQGYMDSGVITVNP